ncbi:MAG: FeoB-associated Cys-rich membrane protein [Desulfobulbaceae bacterium]|nr:FeoB-associated Cys-rich membrane protein [Desulfobulbaceae bacterium]
MENIIVLIIILIAVFFLMKRLLKTFRPGNNPNCDCSCSGCSISTSCTGNRDNSSTAPPQ